MTPNFSGAGLELICQNITRESEFMDKEQWTENKLLRIVSKVAKSLKIYFGNQTYPELKLEQHGKEIDFYFFNNVQQKSVIFLQK